MRVALVTDGIWPYVLGGMQKHSYYLCKYLAQNKVEVDLYHFNSSNFNINDLEYFSNEEKKFIRSIIVDFPVSKNYPGAYMVNSYRHSKLVFEALKDKLSHYDFIYTKGFTGWYLINQKHAGKLSCCPIGVKFHGYEMFQKPPGFKIYLQHLLLLRGPVKTISKKADVVFSYGGKITDIIKSIGVKPEHIFELPSGVEESTLALHINPKGKVLKFLFMGRYERRKGIEELNRAILQLDSLNKNSSCEFHFIGPLPQDKRISLSNVFYHGEIRDRAQMQALVKNCDVLLCPSWSEGMPNVILEAMGMGLAVMATDVGAVNVLVNATTGWLLPNHQEDGLLKALEAILSQTPKQLDEKKQNALDLMRNNFTWENLIQQLIKKLHSDFNVN